MTKYSLVLTCAPSKPIITAQLANAIAELIGGTAPDWLASHTETNTAASSACDIGFDSQKTHAPTHADDPAHATLAQVREKIGSLAIDANIVETQTRRKTLLVADMESTIIEQECLDELADMVGLRDQIAAITARAMRGELDFARALQERVMLLKGLPASTLQKIYDERVTLMSGAAALIATMRQNGAICGLVSGGFSFYAEKIATRLGFDYWQSNHLHIRDGRLDGTIAQPVLGREDKAACLVEWMEKHKLAQAATMAVGDGANDLAMLATASAGVAFHAKPVLAEAANIRIDYSDLTALLYLQGYRAENIIQGAS